MAKKPRSFVDLVEYVVTYAAEWKPIRDRAAQRHNRKPPDDGDREALLDVVLGIASVLEGYAPFDDLRRMRVALKRLDRGLEDRRVNVVRAVHWGLWAWRRTAESPKRRAEIASDLREMLIEERPAFRKLTAEVVAQELERSPRAEAARVAARLSVKCQGFPADVESEDAAVDVFRKAFRKKK